MNARPDPTRRPYLGYRGDDADTSFGRWFRPEMAPLPGDVVDALALGPQAPELLGPLESAPQLLEEGYLPLESGYALGEDGTTRVAVLTRMPGVTAEMWDWWFGWHGCDPRRYKLWHPRAHLFAQWADGPDEGRRGRERYVGRTSFVDEYLGSTLAKAAIQFVEPATLGIDERALAPGTGRTMICARVGSSQFPMDVGYLLHDVRPTPDGCEMRSRFWIGGPYVRPRRPAAGALGPVTSRLGGLFLRQGVTSAHALLAHCSQEMSHLATFLAELHGAMSPADADRDG